MAIQMKRKTTVQHVFVLESSLLLSLVISLLSCERLRSGIVSLWDFLRFLFLVVKRELEAEAVALAEKEKAATAEVCNEIIEIVYNCR